MEHKINSHSTINPNETFFLNKLPNPNILNIYNRQLKYLYKKIDAISSLLWSHENHITGARLRSEKSFDSSTKWQNKKTTQIGYGEITMVIYIS